MSGPGGPAADVRLATVAREWGRLGCVGFGGPPAHVALLRELCVVQRGWMAGHEFDDALAACNLLPGPASTQLAILCAWRVRGAAGALVGGVSFVVPGLALVLVLAVAFLAAGAPRWVLGAAAGAGAAVPAVALSAGLGLVPDSWRRSASHGRYLAYVIVGTVVGATSGSWLVLVLILCGLAEAAARSRALRQSALVPPLAAGAAVGGIPALAWVAFKVGALSYGGGFVIVPLMQADAVHRYHWMSSAQFLDAVALGQVTPGPVTHTVAVVGYAAAGIGGGLLAALVAFAPSFVVVIAGARHLDRLRKSALARAVLDGAGPAAIGGILGVAVPLAAGLAHGWQLPLAALAAVSLLVLRRGVLPTLLCAAALGVAAALAGAAVG